MNSKKAVITQIEKQKKRSARYNVFINGDYSFSVHEDLMIKHRLFKGSEIEEERLLELVQEDEEYRAYLHAIQLISRRPHSTKELIDKLKEKGYEAKSGEAAARRLTELSYLDDRLFAKQWTEQRMKWQKKGRQWVKQELKQKGIAPEYVEEALREYGEEEETDSAMLLARKKWNQIKGELADKKRKTSAYLWRRGYSTSIVQRVIRELSQGEDMEEFDN